MPSDAPTPLVLAFDTSGPYCAAALIRDGDVIATQVEHLARGQAERLMSLLEDVLRDQGQQWSDLSALGVGVGPGNFTGIRISISAARGLGLGLGIPAIGVSQFDTTQRLSKCARTAVPAPRDQFYFFDADSGQSPALIPAETDMTAALSTEYSVEDHVRSIAWIASERAAADPRVPAPKPLYVKPPDAAPARDAPPRVLA